MNNTTKMPAPNGEDWLRVGIVVDRAIGAVAEDMGLPRPTDRWITEARVPSAEELAAWDEVHPAASNHLRLLAAYEMNHRLLRESLYDEMRRDVIARRKAVVSMLCFALGCVLGNLLCHWMGWI